MTTTTPASALTISRTAYSLSLCGALIGLCALLAAAVIWFFVPLSLDLSWFGGPSEDEIRSMSHEQLRAQHKKSEELQAALEEYLRSAEVAELRANHFRRCYWPTLALFNLVAFVLLRPLSRMQVVALLWPSVALFALLQVP